MRKSDYRKMFPHDLGANLNVTKASRTNDRVGVLDTGSEWGESGRGTTRQAVIRVGKVRMTLKC
jgi:hypothetical protein